MFDEKGYVIIFIAAILILLASLDNRKKYRRGREHGSAEWGRASVLRKKYWQRPDSENKLLTQNVGIGLDGFEHRRNLNVMVVGGSGAGKTRFYCKPNIMQANTSYVILDPKAEIVKSTGYLLEQNGYIHFNLFIQKLHSPTTSADNNPGIHSQ